MITKPRFPMVLKVLDDLSTRSGQKMFKFQNGVVIFVEFLNGTQRSQMSLILYRVSLEIICSTGKNKNKNFIFLFCDFSDFLNLEPCILEQIPHDFRKWSLKWRGVLCFSQNL